MRTTHLSRTPSFVSSLNTGSLYSAAAHGETDPTTVNAAQIVNPE
jgi:hypothetical protein